MTTWDDNTGVGRLGSELEDFTSDNVMADTATDDSTDDAAALAEGVSDAISAKKPLRVKGGTTRVTSAALIVTDGLHGLVGAGRGATIIKGAQASNNALPLEISSADNVTVSGLSLIGTAATRDSTSHGLLASLSTDLLVEDVGVGTGVSAGMLFDRCQRVMVRNCFVSGCFADGIHCTNHSPNWTTDVLDFSVIGCELDDTGDDSIAVVAYANPAGSFPITSHVGRVRIIGNSVRNSLAQAIANHGGHDVVIAGNTVAGTVSHGIRVDGEGTGYYLQSPTRTVVTGNTILDAGRGTGSGAGSFHGISVGYDSLDQNDCEVSKNIIRNPRQHGIVVNAPRASVRDNSVVMQSSDDAAIVVGSTSDDAGRICHGSDISGNRVTDGQWKAISVTGTAAAHAKGVRVCNNVIDNPNTGDFATTDAITIRYCDDLLVEGNVIRDPNANLTRAAIWIGDCTRVDIGRNTLSGNTTITLSNCTDVLMPTIVHATDAPADTTTYRAGQQYLRVSTGKLYVFDGTTWQILN